MFGLSWLTEKVAAGVAGFLLVACLALGIGLVVTRATLHTRTVELTAEKYAHEADKSAWAAATATAELQDQQHVQAQVAAQDKVSSEKQNDLQKQLSDARAIAARYVAAHGVRGSQAANDHGSSGTPALPAAADATSDVDKPADYTVVSVADLDACTQAVTVAQGWQSWWKDESTIMQAGAADDGTGSTSVPPKTPIGATIAKSTAFVPYARASTPGTGPTLASPIALELLPLDPPNIMPRPEPNTPTDTEEYKYANNGNYSYSYPSHVNFLK